MNQAGLTALLLSPFAGSFIGVLARRIPAGQNWAWARSACEQCGHVLSAAELVPLVSFAALRGRCRACGAPIGWFHPAIECAAFAVSVIVITVTGTEPGTLWPGCALGWCCLTLFIIDLRHFRLPDVITLPMLLLGLGVTAWRSPEALLDHAAACIAGWAAFRAIALLYRRLRGIDGLGQGDAKLLAAAGAWVGVEGLPIIVCLAALLTLFTVLVRAVWLRQRPDVRLRVPFGPGLATALFACWLAIA